MGRLSVFTILLLIGGSLLPGCSDHTFLRYSGGEVPERPTGPGEIPDGFCSGTITTDFDADGIWEERKVAVFGEEGHILYEQYAHGEDGALVFDSIYYFDWVDGRQVGTRTDLDADGVVDTQTVRFFNELGDLLREETDDRMDGSIELLNEWIYDDLGHLVRYDVDIAADGISDQTITWTRDGEGRPLEVSYDNNGSGSLDLIETYVWDAMPASYQLFLDHDADRLMTELDEIRTYFYEDGRSSAVHWDDMADGVIDSAWTWSHDELERPLMLWMDHEGDGVPDTIRRAHWLGPGALERETWDQDADGRADLEVRFFTDCPPDIHQWYPIGI